jgi:hemoglobin
MSTASLFERLGGSKGINTLVEDIVGLHMQNPVIGPRFRPYLDTPDKLTVTKAHLCAFLEAGSGGTCAYQGRDMASAHRGMNINEVEYVAAIDDILSALKKRGIDDQTQKDVLSIAYGMKDQIMHV